MKSHPLINLCRWFLSACLLLCIGFYFTSKSKIKKLPPAENLVSEILSSPIQKQARAESFTFEYRGVEYGVDPVAAYEISGLLVSHNNIHAWWDYYHDENSVDIKDLCLVWGENLDNGAYLEGKYYNESVSCHAEFKRGTGYGTFGLSNNHIISDSEEVREIVRQMRVGDQVRLKGYLVNYYPVSSPNFIRKTSTTRNDDGGGACEVVYVEEAEIISEYERTWHRIFDFTGSALLPLLVVKVLSFLILPWVEFRFS